MKHSTVLVKTFLFILALSAFMLATSSCSKDSNKSVTDLLTSGPWKFSTLTNTPDTKDFYAYLSEEEKDDLVIFKSEGVVTYDGGATNPYTENKEWLLSVDEKYITIEDGAKWTSISSNQDAIWEIVSLTGTNLTVTYREDYQGAGGYPWQITITFTQ